MHSRMVALMLVSVGLWLPGSDGALSCCFPRPDFHRLGPPPRPPGLTLNLPCNGTECCLATVSLPLGRTPYTKSLEPTTRPSPYPLPTEPIISSSTVSHPESSSPSTISLSPNILEESIATTTFGEPPAEGLSHTVPSPSTLVTGPQPLSSTESAITSAASIDHKATSITLTVTEPSTVRQNARDNFLPSDVVTPVFTEVAMVTESTVVTPRTVGDHISVSGEPSEGHVTIMGPHSSSMQSGQSVMTASSSSPSTSSSLSSSSSSASRYYNTLNTVQLQTQTTSDNLKNDNKVLGIHQYNSNMMSTTAANSKVPNIEDQQRPTKSQGGSSHISSPPSPPKPPPHASTTSRTPSLPPGSGGNGASGADLTSPGETAGSDNNTAASVNIGKPWGIGGLKGGELAALGLGIVVVVLIILVLALYWKKRYKPRVNPTPMKEETNYLHNYRVRGWTWRPGPGPRAPHDDVERSDDKKALITSPVTSHMSLSSGSVDAGYVGGDNGAPPCGDGADQDLVQAKYIMKGESSTSSGIGLSQGDIQEELPPSEDLVTYHPSGSVQILNGRIGGYTDRFGRTPRPKLGKQMYRSQSNNLLRDKLPQSNGHYGYHVRKSASNPNQLDCYPNSSNRPSMPAPTDNRGCEDSMNLQNGHAYRAPIETNGAKSMVFPILEPIRSSHGSDHHSSSASVEYTNGSSGDPHHHSHNPHHYHHHQQQTHHHHTPTPPPPPPPAPLQNINTSHSSRQVHNSRENGDATLPNNRLDPLQDTGSPDTKSHHRKRRKKRRSSSKQELDCADHVALDTISKHRSHTLPPLAGTYSHQTAGTIDKNGEYVA